MRAHVIIRSQSGDVSIEYRGAYVGQDALGVVLTQWSVRDADSDIPAARRWQDAIDPESSIEIAQGPRTEVHLSS